jgi:hypothetical protein
MLVILICVVTVKINLLGELPKGVPLHFSEYFLPNTSKKFYKAGKIHPKSWITGKTRWLPHS